MGYILNVIHIQKGPRWGTLLLNVLLAPLDNAQIFKVSLWSIGNINPHYLCMAGFLTFIVNTSTYFAVIISEVW